MGAVLPLKPLILLDISDLLEVHQLVYRPAREFL